MELTREQAIKEHRKMWNWLAEHPEKWKDDYFKIHHEQFSHINNDCFLCEYDYQNGGKYCGEKCIIDWGNAVGCMDTTSDLGLYKVYYELTSLLRDINKNSEQSKDVAKGLRLIISRTARAIAELPERGEF